MRKFHKLLLSALVSTGAVAIACSPDPGVGSEDDGMGGEASGGADNTGGKKNNTGGGKTTGGSENAGGSSASTGGKNAGGEGGEPAGTGGSDATGGNDGTGGTIIVEPPVSAPFDLDACNATSGPGADVKGSDVGAFLGDSTWLDGWTNWSASANKKGLKVPSTKVQFDGGELTDEQLNWTKDNAYVLNGYVVVPADKTLTIEAGTVILGQINGENGQAGTLFVQRGAKIDAVGTKDEPIVFTSAKADGSKAGGDWGGIVLLGKAHVRQNQLSYEGLSGSTYPWAVFGGGGPETDVDDDDSGEMKYVRIEFGGAVLQSNKEINGLSLGGVGSKTKLSYIEVNANRDDCFEWFGGTVNADHLVCNNGGDDQFDVDDSYRGTISYAFGRGTINSSTDPNGLEWDGISDIANPIEPVATEAHLQHATLCGADGLFGVASYGAVLRKGITGSLNDVFFVGWDASIDTRDVFTVGPTPNMTVENTFSFWAFDGVGFEETGDCNGGDPVTCDDDSGFDEAAWFAEGEGNVDWDLAE